MVITNEQLENIYNYIVNRSKKDTSFPTISYDNLGMFTVLDDKNQNSLLKKSEIEDKFSYLYYETNDLTSKYNNVSSDVNNIKNSYIAKGTTNKTFILDNGERATAIVDINDEVEYDADSLHIDFITSDDDANSKIVHINSATQDRAGLMSAADKKIMDKAVLEGSDTSLNLIEDIEDIIGDSAEGLNISNLNGISALDNNNISVSSMLDIREGMRVEDNKLASFGSRGILLNQGGIDFQYATNISHLVNSKAIDANYENGIACKEAFYVEDGIYVTGESYFNDAIHLNGNDVNLEGGIVDFQEGGFIHFNDVNIKEATYLNTTGIGILSDDETKGVIYSPIDNKLIFKNKATRDNNIKYNYDNGEMIFNLSPLFKKDVTLNNNLDIEINNKTFFRTTDDEDILINVPININSTLTATEVDIQKLLCSKTTDKVTESSSVTKDNINVSYSGNNIDNSTTMTKDGIAVHSENGFTGTSKGSYQAGGLSVSKKETNNDYTLSTGLDENSITFVKTTSSGKKSTKALYIDNNNEFVFTGANVNFNNEINTKKCINVYDDIYVFGRDVSGGHLGGHIYLRDYTTTEDSIIQMINGLMCIKHENSAQNKYPFSLDTKNSIFKIENANNDNTAGNASIDPYSLNVDGSFTDEDTATKGTSTLNANNLGIHVNTKITDKDSSYKNAELISNPLAGFGARLYNDDNNQIDCILSYEDIAIHGIENGETTYKLDFGCDGTTIYYGGCETNISKNNHSLEHIDYDSITIKNTDTSTNKDIDIKNYDVLINDNSRLGFKYNNEVYVFNAQKAIELGLLTKA